MTELFDGLLQWFFNTFVSTGVYRIVWDLASFVAEAFEMVTIFGTMILDNTLLNQVVVYLQGLALLLIVIKVSWASIQKYYLYISGDADENPSKVLIKTVYSVVGVIFFPDLVRILYTFGLLVIHDFASITNAYDTDIEAMFALFDEGGYGYTALSTSIQTTVMFPLIALVALICVLIVIFQFAIRGAQLVYWLVVGVLLCTELSDDNMDGIKSVVRGIAGLSLTSALQLLLINISFSFFSGMENPTSLYTYFDVNGMGWDSAFANYMMVGMSLLFGFAFLFVTISAPKKLEQFLHSTGLGNTVGGGIKQGASMFLMRKMLSR